MSLSVGYPAAASTQWSRCAALLMNQLDINRFFMKFRKDYLPFGATRASRKVDRIDVKLIRSSYEDANYYGPVERGVVELVDFHGETIAKEFVYGSNERISGLNEAVMNLLTEYRDRLDDVALVRRRHTHPQDSRGSILPKVFSDEDMNSDKLCANYLASKPEFQGISLESWIIYMRDGVGNFNTGDLTENYVGIRGYQLR